MPAEDLPVHVPRFRDWTQGFMPSRHGDSAPCHLACSTQSIAQPMWRRPTILHPEAAAPLKRGSPLDTSPCGSVPLTRIHETHPGFNGPFGFLSCDARARPMPAPPPPPHTHLDAAVNDESPLGWECHYILQPPRRNVDDLAQSAIMCVCVCGVRVCVCVACVCVCVRVCKRREVAARRGYWTCKRRARWRRRRTLAEGCAARL